MAISIPTVVGDYIDAVIASLQTGSELNVPPQSVGSGTIHAAAQNYLRAQDAVTILELLQDLLSQSSALTATGGTTTTVVDGAATFVANSYVGAYVVFADDTTTAALQGLTRRITANSTTTLTLDEVLPAACAVGDTYPLVAGQVEEYITAIRGGAGAASQPAGNPYGDRRTVLAGFQMLTEKLGSTIPTRTNDRLVVHPAGQPGDNAYFAAVIDAARDAVAGFTLPT